MTEQDIDKCAICLEPLITDLYTLPECSHSYHTNCIMHWFRSNHTTCPLCNNQGINYCQSYYLSHTGDYGERRLWESYYKEAVRYAKKKDADKEIKKRVKALQKTANKQKLDQKEFTTWNNTVSDGISINKDICRQRNKFRRRKWRTSSNIWRRKVAIGYLYFHKCKKNKLIIAEKVQIPETTL